MGTWYVVVCKLKYQSQNAMQIFTKMRECYKKHIEEGVNFSLEKYLFKEPQNIIDYLELYFVRYQDMFSYGTEVLKNWNIKVKAISSFDASYKWHSVMEDFFKSIAPYLMRGSSLDIDDDDPTCYKIKNGKVY